MCGGVLRIALRGINGSSCDVPGLSAPDNNLPTIIKCESQYVEDLLLYEECVIKCDFQALYSRDELILCVAPSEAQRIASRNHKIIIIIIIIVCNVHIIHIML